MKVLIICGSKSDLPVAVNAGKILDGHVFEAKSPADRDLVGQLPAEGDPAAHPLFVPVGEEAVVVESAHAQAVVGVEEIRVGPASHVAADDVSGHGFDPKPLSAAPPGRPVDDVLKTPGRAKDVEV